MNDDLSYLAVACMATAAPADALHLARDLGLPSWLALGMSAGGNGRPTAPVDVLDAPGRGRPWSDDETAFLRQHYGRMELEDIAAALNRSRNAIKIRATRYGLSIRQARSSAGIYNARQVAAMLGIACSKTVANVIEQGHLVATASGQDPLRQIYRVERKELEAFLARPIAGLVVDPARIRDQHLRAAYYRAGHQPYLTTREAAGHLGTSSNVLAHLARAGTIPATRWSNWFFRQDHLPTIRRILRGRARPKRGFDMKRFTAAEDDTILRGASLGYNPAEIADRLDRPPGSVVGRIMLLAPGPAAVAHLPALHRRRGDALPPALLGLPVPEDGYPLASALTRYRAGECAAADWPHLRAWLRAWFLFWIEHLPAVADAPTSLASDLSLSWHHLRYRIPNDSTLEAEIDRAIFLLNTVGLDPIAGRWAGRWEPYRLAGRTIPAGELVPCPIDTGCADTYVTLADVLQEAA